MKMDGEMKKQIESFLGKYPQELEFPKSKDFQYAHAKLFELVEYVLDHSKNLTPEDENFKKSWEFWKQNGLASQQSLTMVKQYQKKR